MSTRLSATCDALHRQSGNRFKPRAPQKVSLSWHNFATHCTHVRAARAVARRVVSLSCLLPEADVDGDARTSIKTPLSSTKVMCLQSGFARRGPSKVHHRRFSISTQRRGYFSQRQPSRQSRVGDWASNQFLDHWCERFVRVCAGVVCICQCSAMFTSTATSEM